MINREHCSFEVSELLKKRGFDIPCLAYWRESNNQRKLVESNAGVLTNTFFRKNKLPYISAPTHQTVLGWLREKGIHIYVMPNLTEPLFYTPHCIRIGDSIPWKDPAGEEKYHIKSYEKAEEIAIKYSLQNYLQ